MGRWTQYDEDDYRLPEGMKRIGYDADTMRYYFQDQVGNFWQGAEGAEFGEMTRVDILPSSVAPHHRRRPPSDYQRSPLSTEPSRPTADHSKRSYRTLFPFPVLSPSSFSFSGIWPSRQDSRFVQKNVREAHHLTEPSLARVTEKHRKRKDGRLDGDDGRSKISKKSIQTSIVTLSRSVSAKMPFLRVKSLQPVKVSRKNIRSAGKATKGINSRLASVSSRGKQISILRRLS